MNSSIYQEIVFIQATRREKSICALQLQKLRKDCLDEGRAEGRAEGEMKHAIDTAIKMIAGGKLTMVEIAEYSGLPLEKVRELSGNQSA